jgi:LuxR family transcriptional regulator of spore coat protein
MNYFGSEVAIKVTPRELQILRLIAEGFSAKEVALQLNIAPTTVERHVENTRLKTRTRNRAHMIAVAVSSGWLEAV